MHRSHRAIIYSAIYVGTWLISSFYSLYLYDLNYMEKNKSRISTEDEINVVVVNLIQAVIVTVFCVKIYLFYLKSHYEINSTSLPPSLLQG